MRWGRRATPQNDLERTSPPVRLAAPFSQASSSNLGLPRTLRNSPERDGESEAGEGQDLRGTPGPRARAKVNLSVELSSKGDAG